MKIVIFLIFSIILTLVNSLQFQFFVQQYSEVCFSQFLSKLLIIVAESTPFHYKITGQHQNFEIQYLFHDKTLINQKRGPDLVKKIDSYASVSSKYYFCILNNNIKSSFTFNFYQGIQLADLASLPKKEDTILIDQMVDKINVVYQTVKQQETYSRKVNEYNMQLQKMVSFKSVGFVFLSIVVVLIISFLHYLQIKRVLKNRKII